MKDASLNVFGEPLILCGINPMTGVFRNGCCDTGELDTGTHTVCALITDDFLSFSKLRGNDLTQPYPQYNFPGLIDGDRWCLCILRWLEAYRAGMAPKIILKACHQKTLDYVGLDTLKKFAVDPI